ncbi:MAG: lipid-A-disaccharide synthase, partial [Hyphomicrobiales bacterium]|nr:lipid-A-disaccharide synthase [Hyphomicrobiales bacterium]
RVARAALAASGTVTLELALAGVPTVAAYKVGGMEIRILRALVTAPFVLLPNLILGEAAMPELIQEACSSEALTAALAPLLEETTQRRAQIAALERVRERVAVAGASPAERAARVVISELTRG